MGEPLDMKDFSGRKADLRSALFLAALSAYSLPRIAWFSPQERGESSESGELSCPFGFPERKRL